VQRGIDTSNAAARLIALFLGLLAAWLSLSVVAPCGAAEETRLASDYVIRNWQTEEGLPQNSVCAILQTRDGYLWFGTFNGLVRFDGVQFTTFNLANSPEMGSDSINCLFEDHLGHLWIGTDRGGLSRYAQGQFTNYGLTNRPGASVVSSIAEDRAGTLWVATDGGLFRLVAGRPEMHEPASVPEGFGGVQTVCWDRDGQLWIASDRGLFVQREDSLRRLPEYAGVTRVTACDDGGVWLVADRTGLVRLRQGNKQEISTERVGEPPWCVTTSRRGDLWFWGKKPLSRVRGGRVSRYSLPEQHASFTILAVYEDREENIWVGLNGGGVLRLRETVVDTISSRQGLFDDDVVVLMEETPGRVWIGGYDCGIGVWESNRFARLPGLSIDPKTVYALSRGIDGSIWMGVREGRLVGWQNGKVVHDEAAPWESVRVLFFDREGDLWVGSRIGGAERRLHDNQQRIRYSRETGLSDNAITAITQDKEGAIWIGTTHGLNRIQSNQVTQFYRQQGLGSDRIDTLLVDQEGVLWVGTVGGGLAVAQDGRFVTIGAKQGLANEVIGQILEDGRGFLWLGSNGGILRVKREELLSCARGKQTTVYCQRFGRQEGMLNPECAGGFQPACLKAHDGRLWFATVGGVVIVDPSRLRTNSWVPPVHIESVTADHSPCPILNPGATNAQARIPAGTTRLQVGFTGLGFAEPEDLRFQCWLEGLDANWVDVGSRRTAYFNRLRPGDYAFRVRACNSDGRWYEEYSQIILKVAPHWWQTLWCRWLAGIGTAAAALTAAWFLQERRLGRALELQERRSAELRASELGAANRVLQARTEELESALSSIKTLRGLIPICSGCKKIRDDKGYWEQVESYVSKHSDAVFTHGLCPDCIGKYFPEPADKDLPREGN
jgi:ligand-binding sensor domain-containing protein